MLEKDYYLPILVKTVLALYVCMLHCSRLWMDLTLLQVWDKVGGQLIGYQM